jgi:hypothetical protein
MKGLSWVKSLAVKSLAVRGVVAALAAAVTTTVTAATIVGLGAIEASARPVQVLDRDRDGWVALQLAPNPRARVNGWGYVGQSLEAIDAARGTDGYIWYLVQQGPQRGWLREDQAKLMGQLPFHAGGGSRSGESLISGIVAGSGPGASVNFRMAPSTAARVGYLGRHGDRVEVFNRQQNWEGETWLHVVLSDRPEIHGWVREDLVNLLF